MLLQNFTNLILPYLTCLTNPNSTSIPPPHNQTSTTSSTKHVSIIGAGIAGTTAAYFLHDYLREIIPVEITIYESQPQIGGRTSSVKYRHQTFEDGAQYWSEDDWCMKLAMSEVGLKPKEKSWEFRMMGKETIGIWNGKEFVVEQIDSTEFSSWWELARDVWYQGYSAWLLRKVSFSWLDMGRYVWKYGTSPLRLRKAVLRELTKYGRVGVGLLIPPPRERPFDRLSDQLTQKGLTGLVLEPADAYLHSLNLTERFINEVVQPLVRARFGKDLDEVTGLSSLIAVRDLLSSKISIADGNQRLDYRLIKLSEAKLELNSHVQRIQSGDSRRYRLLIESTLPGGEEPASAEFDAIIITAPVSLTTASDDGGDIFLEPLPAVERHTTIFATHGEPLSPQYFNLSSNFSVPGSVLTTTNSSLEPPIYSITKLGQLYYLDKDCEPPSGQDDEWACDVMKHERIYRVISAQPIDNCTLAKMVGRNCDYNVPFVHRRTWPVYYQNFSTGTKWIDDVERFPFIFSAGGAEDLIVSLEMSCRMGYNALGKLYMKWR